MNNSTNINPALEIFDEAYSDFDYCFKRMGFNTIEQWSFEFETGALNCSAVFKSFTAEQLQELYDVVHLNAFARAQIASAWYCADERNSYSDEMKCARETVALTREMNAQMLRFKIMAMENMARATDSYAMDFTL